MGREGMKKQELEKELLHKTEELNRIKEVLAIFVDKVYDDVDNITPEDLEYKLREFESKQYRKLDNSDEDAVTYQSWITEIIQLCQQLGWSQFSGYTTVHNIKLFIKALARENYNLKQMEGAKQKDGGHSDNLGSIDTITNRK